MEITDLTHHIQSIRLVDTHEHMKREAEWVENGPDILQDLFGNYVPADLVTAGASPEAMRNLMDASQDITSRFGGVWKWSDNTSLGVYSNWGYREPSKGKNQHCVVLVRGFMREDFFDAQWNDVRCERTLFYLCEKKS